jgi:hypothetical protein
MLRKGITIGKKGIKVRRDTLNELNKPLNKLLSLIICSLIANAVFIVYKGVFDFLGYLIYLPITFLVMLLVGLPISLFIDWMLLKRSNFIKKSLLLHSLIYFLIILLPTGNLEVMLEMNVHSLVYFLLFSLIPVLYWTINYFITRGQIRQSHMMIW